MTSDDEGSGQGDEVFSLEDGAVRVWIEQETIHLIAVERPWGDPVELTAHMARRLAEVLGRMASRLDD